MLTQSHPCKPHVGGIASRVQFAFHGISCFVQQSRKQRFSLPASSGHRVDAIERGVFLVRLKRISNGPWSLTLDPSFSVGLCDYRSFEFVLMYSVTKLAMFCKATWTSSWNQTRHCQEKQGTLWNRRSRSKNAELTNMRASEVLKMTKERDWI